jgi:signal transduction histidine kinase
MIQSSYKFIRSGNSDSLFLSAGLFSVLVSFGHDILIRFGFFKEGVFLVTLGLTIFFVVLVIIFSNTVFQMRSDLQNQKEILKRKLAARESALLMEKDKHIALARNSAILNENARLTRDLHDGVLTYLSMIQALSENKGNQDKKLISRIARYASQEIRLILESGSEQDREILLMLATFRQQVVEPMVGQKKILVNWNIANLVDQKMTSNSSSLNLFRILQETFHNAYERAGCTYIHVWSELHDPNIIKIIIENTGGSTFNPECRYGNGIKNMVRRARLIGATFDIQPIFSGARVVITLTRLQTH